MGPCPTGGRDKGDGSFCEACGVYNHAEAARQRRAEVLPLSPRTYRIGRRLRLAVNILVFAVLAFVFVNSRIKRARAVQERLPSPPRVFPSPTFNYTAAPRRVEVQRAWSVTRQAEVNRRLDEALKSRPPEKPPETKQERRRKIQAAREGLGL